MVSYVRRRLPTGGVPLGGAVSLCKVGAKVGTLGRNWLKPLCGLLPGKLGTTSAGLLSDIAIVVTPSFSGRAHFTASPVSLMVMEAGLTYQARDRAVSARTWMRSPNPVGKPT